MWPEDESIAPPPSVLEVLRGVKDIVSLLYYSSLCKK